METQTDPTPGKKPEPIPSEFSLTEYPLYLLANRVPKGTEAIEWEQDIYVDGKRTAQHWQLSGNATLGGLPTAPDGEAFMAVRYAAHLSGLKSKSIPLQSVWTLFRELGHTDSGTVYRRFKEALVKYTGVKAVTRNAMWDTKQREYEVTRVFGLFDEVTFIEPRKNKTTGAPSKILGHVTLSDYLFHRLKNGNTFDLNFREWAQLDHPATRRAYEYLEKQRGRGNASFSMEIRAFLIKLGYARATVERYPIYKCKQLLRESYSGKQSHPAVLETLKQRGYLSGYTFRQNKASNTIVVIFWAHPTTRSEHANRYNLSAEQVHQAEGLAIYIGEVIGQAEQNAAFYFTVAAEAIAGRYIQSLHIALSNTKQAHHDGTIRTTKSQYFHDQLTRLRDQLDLLTAVEPSTPNQSDPNPTTP